LLKTLKLVRAYSIPLRDPRVSELITWYAGALQKAIDIIWSGVEWRYEFPRLSEKDGKLVAVIGFKLKVPIIPKDSGFRRMLRSELLKDCPYASHWVDSVIRTAYSIVESWRKRYLKGRAKKAKPKVKRRFARCKITLMKIDYNAKAIRITLKPWEYLTVSWKGAWFDRRVRGWTVGEVVIKDDRVIIPFKNSKVVKVKRIIGWDSNELSLDGYEPGTGFIHIDLRPLQSIKIVYEKKKAIAQSKGKRELYEKYKAREKNRVKDFINKLSAGLVRLLPNSIHVFEALDKENLTSKERVSKGRRKRNARTPWRKIHKRVSEVALTGSASPKYTSRECPKCGFRVKTQVGHTFECPRCGLKMNRHNVAAMNIRRRYLKGKPRMWGFPRSEDPEETMKVELRAGVTLNGRSPMIWAPMKWGSEGNEAKGRGA
jgi:putative transposase